MTVNTTPQGAECELHRDNKLIQRLTTPQTITLKKTKHDITVVCNKDGYEQSTHYVKSEIQDATWGNIVLGGGIGWAVDSASGADNKYAEYVNISMVPTREPSTSQANNSVAPAATAEDNSTPAMGMGMSMDNNETTSEQQMNSDANSSEGEHAASPENM